MEALMVALGTQVQSIKQCLALRTALDDERCWASLAQLEALLSAAEQQADEVDNYLTAEGASCACVMQSAYIRACRGGARACRGHGGPGAGAGPARAPH